MEYIAKFCGALLSQHILSYFYGIITPKFLDRFMNLVGLSDRPTTITRGADENTSEHSKNALATYPWWYICIVGPIEEEFLYTVPNSDLSIAPYFNCVGIAISLLGCRCSFFLVSLIGFVSRYTYINRLFVQLCYDIEFSLAHRRSNSCKDILHSFVMYLPSRLTRLYFASVLDSYTLFPILAHIISNTVAYRNMLTYLEEEAEK